MFKNYTITDKEDGTYLVQIQSEDDKFKSINFVYNNVRFSANDSKISFDSTVMYHYFDENDEELLEDIRDVNEKYISKDLVESALNHVQELFKSII